MREPRGFRIALSALACAVAAAALTAGAYFPQFVLAAGYLIAAFALMVPLSKDIAWGAFLAEIGAFLLAFCFCGFSVWTLLPFLVFFGLHPIVNWLQRKFVKKFVFHALCFAGKAAWFDGVLLLVWFTLGELLGIADTVWYPYVAPYLYLTVFLGGTAFFAAYDFMMFLCQRSVDAAVRRIRR